jgi:hypothetical protein
MDVAFHRPSDRIGVECVALVIILMISLPIITITKQLREKSSPLGKDIYQAVLEINSKLTEAAQASGLQDSDVEIASLEFTQQNEDHALEALGKVLTETARRLERFKEYEAKWRPMFLSIIKEVADEYEDERTAYRILLRLADKNHWPSWAVRCLPDLYDRVETESNGVVVAHVSQYVLGGLSRAYGYEILRKLCGGEVLKVAMPPETAKRVEEIAESLEKSLRRNPNESDRAFIGTIITIWSEREKISTDAGDSQKFKEEREKVLDEENVMSAQV